MKSETENSNRIKIRIKNFEILRDATLTVDGLTGVIGDSNNGKTSIFRAIKTAFNNIPGNSYINQHSKSCAVGFLFEEDKTKISWQKETSASYSFKGAVLEKTGRKTPPIIDSYLNMSPIELDDDKIDLNFLEQLEPPLIRLLTESKTYKLLVKSMDGDKISSSIELCMDDITKNKQSVKDKRSEHAIHLDNLNKLKSDYKKYQNLENLKPIYQKVQNYPNLLEKLRFYRESFNSDLKDILELREKVSKFQKKIGLFDNFQYFLLAYNGYSQKRADLQPLVKGKTDLLEIVQRIDLLKKKGLLQEALITALSNKRDGVKLILSYNDMKSIKEDVANKRETYNALRTRYERALHYSEGTRTKRELLKALQSSRSAFIDLSQRLDELRASLSALEENLTIYINNELCPLCGAPMTDKNHLDLELLNTKIEAMKSEQTKLVTEIQIKEGQVTKLAGEIQAMGYDPANLDNEIKKVEDSLVAFEQEATLYLKEIEQL